MDNCVNHKCGNGGTCVDGINSYSCRCVAGFTGNHCQNSELSFYINCFDLSFDIFVTNLSTYSLF